MKLTALSIVLLCLSASLAQLSPSVCPFTSPTPTVPRSSKTSTNKTPAVTNNSGALLFLDRTYKLVSKPAFLNEASFVQLFNDDKSISTSTPYVNLTLNVPSLVYIAFDSRTNRLPAWLNSSAWRQTSSSITRQDAKSPLVMNLFVSTSASTTFSLGATSASPAQNVDSMYVPFVVPYFECNYFSFSDSFDRADGGPGERYVGGDFDGSSGSDWYILNGNLVTNASGYNQVGGLSSESYTHTSYTLQTRATGMLYSGWGAFFMFGAEETIDPYSEHYRVTWYNSWFSNKRLTLAYYDVTTYQFVTLAAANFTGTFESIVRYQITKDDAGLISVFVSTNNTLPATPVLTAVDLRIPALRHYGWAQTTEPPTDVTVEYINACGRVCA